VAHVDVNGIRVNLPDNVARLSRAGIADYLVSQAGFAPEELGETVPAGGTFPPRTDDRLQLGASGDPTAGVGVSEAQAVGFGRFLTERGIGQDVGDAGIAELRGERPIATAVGESIPFVPAGASILGAAGIGAGAEALRGGTPASIATQGALQGGATLGGRIAGDVVGRVGRGMAQGVRNQIQAAVDRVDTARLPTGIRTTVGKLTDSRAMQQVEASLARNPVTSRRFLAIDRQNEAVMRDRALEWLGVADAPSLEIGVARALNESLGKMAAGIPDNATILISKDLDDAFRLLNRVQGEAFDLPVGRRATSGAAIRAVISDLQAGVRSGTATVRRRSRNTLDALNEAIGASGEVNQPLFREGSRQYGRFERITRRNVISRTDPEKINPTPLLNSIEKGNKVAVRTKGNVASGDEATDALIRTARDFERVGSLTPDSGTPTGLAVPIIAADIVQTGGLGTLGAFAGAEVAESPFGLSLVESLTRRAAGAAQGAAQTFRGAAGQLPVRQDQGDDENDNDNTD